ncbi:M28 family peptidase [Clostridium estertheticum]|uniref:M28 family metallopeptidase n=1 Tax=Clostridium estertheticum TaxID=238834 RepID=UPI001CC9DBCC|nr:M28 family peptidase [Clostridium estertheticum]MBZ9608914.1 M28 family peptidase [Clostridium estertheticum]
MKNILKMLLKLMVEMEVVVKWKWLIMLLVLSKVMTALFDHLGYVNGKLIRGALDNASGIAAIVQTAHKLEEKSKIKLFDTDIIVCVFNGEETGLNGSRALVKEIKSKLAYTDLYNINIDCIGGKEGGKLALKNKSTVSNKLYDAVKISMKKNNIEFADVAVHGLGDHLSFERAGIPNVFFVQENVVKLVHKPTDTPSILDYGQINKTASAICNFIETNDGVDFDPVH